MAAKTLPGFRREKGAARGYVNIETGERLSRRQYDKLVSAQGQHGKLDAQREAIHVRSQRNYNRLLSDYVEQRRRTGKPITKSEARKSDEMKRIIRDIKAKGSSAEAERKRRTALELTGNRQGIPEWVPVGLSDKYRKGKLRRSRIPKAYRIG